MAPVLALVVNNIGGLLMLFVGVCVCAGIVFFIMRALTLPPMAFTIFYVAMGILLLIVAIDFFFGGSGHVAIGP